MKENYTLLWFLVKNFNAKFVLHAKTEDEIYFEICTNFNIVFRESQERFRDTRNYHMRIP